MSTDKIASVQILYSRQVSDFASLHLANSPIACVDYRIFLSIVQVITSTSLN